MKTYDLRKKSFKLRVYYYDTDKMGVVYHSNYLKWMEMARTEYFRDVFPYKNMEDMGFILPVKTLNIEYVNSAKYDEEIEIFVKIEEINNIKNFILESDINISDKDIEVIYEEYWGCRKDKINIHLKFSNESVGNRYEARWFENENS